MHYLLTSHDCFPRKRKDTAGRQETQESYSTLIKTLSTREKGDEKILLWPALTTKCLWYGLPKLANKLPQNVHDNRRGHKLYRDNHENLESGADSKKEKLSRSEGPERYVPAICTFTTAFYNSNDATQLYS